MIIHPEELEVTSSGTFDPKRSKSADCVDYWKWVGKVVFPWAKKTNCAHDRCAQCGGSGLREDGLGPCVHMISCSCDKCRINM